MVSEKFLVLSAFVFFVAYSAIRAGQEKNKYFIILLGLACLYPLGKVLQFWHFGPIILRCYLSDVGFVPMAAFFPIAVALNWKTVDLANRFANLGLLIALGMEFLQMMANSRIPKHQFGARGDWWDVVVFGVSWILVKAIVGKLKSSTPKPKPAYANYAKKKRKQHRGR